MDQDDLELRLAEQTAILLDAEPRGLESKVVRRVRTPEGAARFGVPIGTIITRDIIERAQRQRRGGRADTPSPRPSGGKPEKPKKTGGRLTTRPTSQLAPGMVIEAPGEPGRMVTVAGKPEYHPGLGKRSDGRRQPGHYNIPVEDQDQPLRVMEGGLIQVDEDSLQAPSGGASKPERRESSTPIRTVEVSEVKPGMRVSYGGPDHAFEVAGVVGKNDEGQWEFTDDKGRPARFPDGAKLDVYAEPLEGAEADRPGDDDPEGQAAFDRGLEQGAAARERGKPAADDDDEPAPPSGAAATGAGGSRLPADDEELDALEVIRGRYDEPRPSRDEVTAAEDALRERGWSDEEIDVATRHRTVDESLRQVTPPPETIVYDPGNDLWVLGEEERPRAPRSSFGSEKEARSFAKYWGFDVLDRGETPNPPTDGGDGGVPAEAVQERPRPTPEMEARGDGMTPLPEGRYPAGDPRNDPAYEAYVERVDQRLARALDQGLDTESQHSAVLPDGSRVWRRERQDMHYAIIDQILADADERGVPKDGLAVMMGGLPGAGKSTFLRNHGDKLGLEIDANGDPVNAVVVNPDLIKDALMTGTYPDGRPLVETAEGLQRGEMAGLIHEESSVIAKMLAERVLAGNYNVVFDITLGDGEKARRKFLQRDDGTGALDRGYRVRSAFVDGDLATSLHRAGLRHKQPDPANNGKRRMGGRYVPYSHITREAQADGLLDKDGNPAKSRNRVEYDRLVASGIFESAIRYDNVTDEFFTDQEGPADGDGGDDREALLERARANPDEEIQVELPGQDPESDEYYFSVIPGVSDLRDKIVTAYGEDPDDDDLPIDMVQALEDLDLVVDGDDYEAMEILSQRMFDAGLDFGDGGSEQVSSDVAEAGRGNAHARMLQDERFDALASRLEDVYAGADSDADDDADRRALELAEEYGLSVDEVRDAALQWAGFGPDDEDGGDGGPPPGADGLPAVAEERAALVEFARENPNAEVELVSEAEADADDPLVSMIPGVDDLAEYLEDLYGDEDHPDDMAQLLEELDLTMDASDDEAMALLMERLTAAGYAGGA